MAKQPVPEVRSTDPIDYLFRKAVRDNINRITASSVPSLGPLPPNATLADVVEKLNQLIARLEA